MIASVSGGKDSTALCLWLIENSIPFFAVHMNTGWEHFLTDHYLTEILPKHIGTIKWIEPPLKMVDLILKKGMFPSRTVRFCTQSLKIFPLLDWVEKKYGDQPVLNVVGIRADESKARSRLPELEKSDFGYTWRPILKWSKKDVQLIHKKYSCPPNPLYIDLGVSRVGCWPCIFARKAELKKLFETDFERYDLIANLETQVQIAAKNRYTARGETFESLGYTPPCFFSHNGKNLPIKEVKKWACGRYEQLELFFDNEQRSSCLEWGLCAS